MDTGSCGYVIRYLDAFLDREARSTFEVEAISSHVSSCPACYQRLSVFFRTVELPESAYLRETIDELALALYNLAKAVIRDLPPASQDDNTENVIITEEGGGSVHENLSAGVEMIEDAQDYAGSRSVAGMDLDALRDLLENTDTGRVLRIDLALDLFRRVTALPSRYEAEAWNWVGVLCTQKEDFDAAEEAFSRVLAAPDGARNTRSWAHCNLGYVHKHRGDLDRAIRSARRSVVLAEEDGKDPFFGRFAGLYFASLRQGEGDASTADGLIDDILRSPGGLERMRQALTLETNRPIDETLRGTGVYERFPGLDPRLS